MTNPASQAAREAALKPCPFCGANAREATVFADTLTIFTVECSNCEAERASDKSHAEARELWNTRFEQQIRDEIINTPETADFMAGVPLEAAHQRERWGAAHDAGKQPEDWYWLVGYLAGKALHAAKTGDTDKALHHTISTAAALANWHAHLTGASTAMRPGIDPVERNVA